MKTHFIVQTAAAFMPSSCWGKYGKVAILEVEEGIDSVKMISARARGVVRVVRVYDRLSKGKTDRCAFNRALIACQAEAAALNARSAS